VRARQLVAKIVHPPLLMQAREAVRTLNGAEAEAEAALAAFRPLECLPDGRHNATHLGL